MTEPDADTMKRTRQNVAAALDELVPLMESAARLPDVHEREVAMALMYAAATLYIASHRLGGAVPTVEEFFQYVRPVYDWADRDVMAEGVTTSPHERGKA